MRIIFARHGETDYNVAQRICGTSPAMLTEKGKMQARELGRQLVDQGIDLIICSPMQRAKDTATLVNETLHCDIVVEERLTEWDYGSYEGRTQCMGEDFQKAKLEFGVKLGGGESVLQLSHRVYAAIDDIRATYAD